jgi:hypothetical protein
MMERREMEHQENLERIGECVVCHEEQFPLVAAGCCEYCVERIIERMLDDARYAREDGNVGELARIMHMDVTRYLEAYLAEENK